MDEENKLARFEPPDSSLDRSRPGLLSPFDVLEAEEGPDLLAHWRTIRKRRLAIFTVFCVVFTVALLATLKQKPVYRAKTLIEIQKENPNVATVQELFELETVSDTYLETQYKILNSEALARRVIEELRLIESPELNPPPPWWMPRRGQREKDPAAPGPAGVTDPHVYQATLEEFQDRLSVKPVKRSRLVGVSFDSQDPELASRIVNTLAANYIDLTLEARWDATQKATEWLGQQLQGLKAKLEKSEEELQRYATQNGLLFLEGEKGTTENIVNQRLRQLQEELTRAQAVRYEKESLYRLIQGCGDKVSKCEAGDYGSLPGVFESKLMQDLTARLAELKRERAQLLTTFSPEYPRVRQLQSQVDEVESVLERERDRAARRITKDYQAAVEREELLQQAFRAEESRANVVAERSVQYNILKREVETNRQLYEGLLQRMKEAAVSAGLKASNVRIVDVAEPPTKPVKPRILLNLSLGALLGLALGVGLALLQEHLDNTVKSGEDVERFLQLPALAFIPSVQSMNGHRGSTVSARPALLRGTSKELIAQGAGDRTPLSAEKAASTWYRIDKSGWEHSALSEAFRGLRTSVLLSSAERPPRTLLVSSAQPGEGKTTISTNVALSLAQLGHRVLLIDADLRRPSVHKMLQLPNRPGLVSYLTGQSDWQSLVQPSAAPGLDVFVCGPIPPNPAELLSSERMRNLIQQAATRYPFVLLDSPPLLNVADSRILATLVEGVVLVVKASGTARDVVRRAHVYARNVGANVIGVVLNNLDVRADGYYGYYASYHDAYEADAEEKEAPAER